MKVLFMHPEGNFNNNPNLLGIFEILVEAGWNVELFVTRRSHSQIPPSPKCQIRFESSWVSRLRSRMPDVFQHCLSHICSRFWKRGWKDVDLIVGVDREGIIYSHFLSQRLRCPFGLISYEIYFEDETSFHFKDVERRACQGLDFAVCQDEVRSRLLCGENSIPSEMIFQIPVSGRGVKIRRGQRRFFHERYSLKSEHKVALLAGSLTDWSMVEEVLRSFAKWPDSWILVLHDRYGRIPEKYKQLARGDFAARIKFSTEEIPSHDSMWKLLHSADLGLAFYRPTYYDKSQGKNLEFIGMSSGKISTYVQHGLPVMTNEIGAWSRIIDQKGLGIVISDFGQIPEKLAGFHRDNFEDNCYRFFNQELDLDKRVKPLIDLMGKLVSQRR